VLVRYLMDDTVKTPEDVEKYLQLSTLAVIPLNEGESEGKKKKKKVKRS
jgi:capsular polysaccharide biosynthesis protein